MPTERDPVTGAEVDRSSAIRVDHGDHVHYFASDQSRDEFLADPARYHDEHATRHADSARGEGTPSNWPDENPPITTDKHGFTAPRFGSAGSGGAEFEPLPPGARD
jgi:YHS domain-containing protein